MWGKLAGVNLPGDKSRGHRAKYQLFTEKRVCICCGAEARRRRGFQKRLPGEPAMIGIVSYVCRQGSDKSRVQSGLTINLCEACVISALGGPGQGVPASVRKLSEALRESILLSYSLLQARDAA